MTQLSPSQPPLVNDAHGRGGGVGGEEGGGYIVGE